MDSSASNIASRKTGIEEVINLDSARHAPQDTSTSEQNATEVVTSLKNQALTTLKTAGPPTIYRPFRMIHGAYWPPPEGVSRGKKWRLDYPDPA